MNDYANLTNCRGSLLNIEGLIIFSIIVTKFRARSPYVQSNARGDSLCPTMSIWQRALAPSYPTKME